MSVEQNKAIVRRYIEDVWGKGDYAAESELLAPDFVDHNPQPGLAPDRAGHHQALLMFRAACPDTQITVEDLVAEGDKVVDRWTMRATHRGELFGIPPTGRQFTITGMDVLRIVNGKIAETWHQEDALGMMQQLGVLPAPGQAQKKAA